MATEQEPRRNGVIALFARHPVAANLIMTIMFVTGLWALSQLNKQFFPDFNLDFVSVIVAWSGAGAEDVEKSIVVPLEQALRNVDHVKKLTSTAEEGAGVIIIEFREGSDISLGAEQVRQEVDRVTTLPPSAEEPKVARIVAYENIAKVLVYGSVSMHDLAILARRYESELLQRGISKVDISGLPSEEIAIQVPTARLSELGLSLVDIGRRIASFSQDLPAGATGRAEGARRIRFLAQRRDEGSFAELPFLTDSDGRVLRVGDIAEVERRPRQQQVELYHRGSPAIELLLQRASNADSLESAQVMEQWLSETRTQLPPGVQLAVIDEQWQLLRERINLLLKNAAGGLILVVLVLYLFMSPRVAFWIAAGIPISFFGMLTAYLLLGGSINMISLFAMIMALGIIVDDAIVVGEDTLTRFQQGRDAASAAISGGRRMLAPVMSSSLTTIAAFMPLLLVSGIIGSILSAIPAVVICVIIASLIECFLVLPGHLHHSLRRTPNRASPTAVRRWLDDAFERFREHWFRPLVTLAVSHSATTLVSALVLMLTAVALVTGGHLRFNFFPTPEERIVYAEATFVAGTPRDRVSDYLAHLERALYEAEEELGGDLVNAVVARRGAIQSDDQDIVTIGDHVGSLLIELTGSDHRAVRNREIIAAWNQRLEPVAGLETLILREKVVGPPGRDLQIELSGTGPRQLKAAAEELALHLGQLSGVSGIGDDMPYGNEQLVMELSPVGRRLGLSVTELGQQMRAAYDGYVAQTFSEGLDDVEVRVVLPDNERHRLSSLDTFQVALPGGGVAPLPTVADYRSKRGFDLLRHSGGKLTVTVAGDVNPEINNANIIIRDLQQTVAPQLKAEHGVTLNFTGLSEDQETTIGDMKRGALLALVMIYLVLAWVFSSYGWPLLIISIIPMGLVGALWGHWWMGLDLTILSLFGFFGLSGVVINDSIILVVLFKELRERGMAPREAVIEAACRRLRAVLLTSLTTVGGLTPLLFERSLQAQFLIPMATSFAFGVAFATVIVLLLIPALLLLYENTAARITAWRSPDPATV